MTQLVGRLTGDQRVASSIKIHRYCVIEQDALSAAYWY